VLQLPVRHLPVGQTVNMKHASGCTHVSAWLYMWHLCELPVGLCRGATVFSVPGVHVMLPSPRGVVRFTPMFLNRQQLYDTISFVQDLVARHVRDFQTCTSSCSCYYC
jgi:hypothetical protein